MQNIPLLYIIIAVVLAIGLIDTAFTRIPALARLKWSLKSKRKVGKGAVILGSLMALCIGSAVGCYFYETGIVGRRYTVHDDQSVTTSVDAGILDSFTSDIPEYDLSDYYLYSQLDDFDKELYEIYYDLALHSGDIGYKRTLSMEDWKYNAHLDDFSKVFYAMIMDHPEFFYLQNSNSSSRLDVSGYSTAGMSHVDFSLLPGSGDEDVMIKRFEAAADEFMSGIDLSVSDAEIELQIHDKLISGMTYDFDALSEDGFNLAHTAYGALCDDGMGNRNSALCDGYAKAFQYLLHRAGICSIVVSGIAGTNDGGFVDEGDHAWNIVLLDGEWYEVDCCWDDFELERMELSSEEISYIEKNLQAQYFAATHWYFNRTTDEMKQIQASDKYIFIVPVQNGSISFDHCRQSYHLREKDPESEGYEAFKYINDMLPDATGTRYGLGL